MLTFAYPVSPLTCLRAPSCLQAAEIPFTQESLEEMIEIMDFDSSDEVNWEKFHTFVSYKARNQGRVRGKVGGGCEESGCAEQGNECRDWEMGPRSKAQEQVKGAGAGKGGRGGIGSENRCTDPVLEAHTHANPVLDAHIPHAGACGAGRAEWHACTRVFFDSMFEGSVLVPYTYTCLYHT